MEFQGTPGVLKNCETHFLNNTLVAGLSSQPELFDKEGWYLYTEGRI